MGRWLRQDLNPGLLEGLSFYALWEISKQKTKGPLSGTLHKGLSTSTGLGSPEFSGKH